jgi:phosphohistidine swiveling domain-containing protein
VAKVNDQSNVTLGREVPSSWDPLHATSPVGRHWSRANIGEALPGVLTPLTWSLWEVASEGAARGAFHALGAASRAEAMVPADREQRFMRAFYGRGAAQLEFLSQMGDRIPGTSGAAIAEQVFGSVPENLVSQASRKRYPIIAARMPWTFFRTPGQLKAAAADTRTWWTGSTATTPVLNEASALRLFSEAIIRFRSNVTLQATTLFCVVQPIYDMLERLTSSTGEGDLTALASGYGSMPEAAVVGDLWKASRGQLELSEIVARHGFHGPREGEMMAYVWREDDGPLHRFISEYAALDASQDPQARQALLLEHRLTIERDILAALPAHRRPVARQMLRIASRTIPLRGVAKDSFLQASDVIRASARRIGHLLHADGVLNDPDDIFFLTDDEIVGTRPADVKVLIARRRERHEHYAEMDLPTQWEGDPDPIVVNASAERTDEITGIGVSPGIVEGVARVVLDPNFEDVEPGEILVAPSTDPSWSSIMFLSSALVVDIGGALSHAAIVARELGVPCVVSTVSGSRTIHTGDLCRVDGTTGIVTILSRPDEDASDSDVSALDPPAITGAHQRNEP